MKYRVYILVLVGVCAIFGAAYAWQVRETTSPDQRDWERRITSDAEGALAEYRAEGAALSYDEAHALAHIVGSALFHVYGIEGIRYCSADFSYGCYHAVAAEALRESGPDGRESIAAACASARDPLACVHGAGHGILSSVGEDRVAEAFELCAPLNTSSEVGGCWGGVMMEYNFRTMQSPAGVDVRSLDESAPEGPCPTLAHKYRPACYYELPAWWRTRVESGGEMNFDWTKVGDMCAQTPEEVRPYCFRGIGNVIAPQSGYFTKNIEASCAALSYPGASFICVHEALGHLLSDSGGMAKLRGACRDASDAVRAFCVEHKIMQ